MKETPHKIVDDPAPEQTHTAADRTFLERIQTALFRRKKDEKTNPKHPILEGFLAFDRAQKEEGHTSDLNQRGIPGEEARKDTPHKTADDPAPERTHRAAERPILGWIRTNLFPQKKETIETALKVADALAYERTRMAADRTLMGWIRTALSMIGFGFTIYKFMQSIEESRLASKQSPEAVGLTLIGIGVFSLTIACLQHWKFIKDLRPDMPYKPWDLTFIVAFLIGGVGVVMFISIILQAGPLG